MQPISRPIIPLTSDEEALFKAARFLPKNLESENCSICLDHLANNHAVVKTPCRKDTGEIHPHFFHEACVRPWIEQHKSCPNCRATIRPEMLVRVTKAANNAFPQRPVPPTLSEKDLARLNHTLPREIQGDDCIICQTGLTELENGQGKRIVKTLCQGGMNQALHPHFFHDACVRPWVELHKNCPVCRSSITSSDLVSIENVSGNAWPQRRVERIVPHQEEPVEILPVNEILWLGKNVASLGWSAVKGTAGAFYAVGKALLPNAEDQRASIEATLIQKKERLDQVFKQLSIEMQYLEAELNRAVRNSWPVERNDQADALCQQLSPLLMQAANLIDKIRVSNKQAALLRV